MRKLKKTHYYTDYPHPPSQHAMIIIKEAFQILYNFRRRKEGKKKKEKKVHIIA